MENDILFAIKIKEVIFEQIEPKRNKIEISTEELNGIIEDLVNNGVIQMQGENQNATYNLSAQPESDDVGPMDAVPRPYRCSSKG